MADAAPLIFVVDDDRGLLRLIAKTLEREGFGTASAPSAKEAITWLQANQPDLMLLDLKLQDMPGRDLVQTLVAAGRAVPFVVITGQGDERVAVEMMKGGALDYLVKDGQFQEFLPTFVRRALEQLERDRRLLAAEEERRRLEQQILDAGDRERRRIGQDLHDGLGQQLAGIELMMQALEEEVTGVFPRGATKIATISGYLREAIRQSKALARGLSPVDPQANGLMSALEELTVTVSNLFRARCVLDCPAPVWISDNVAATHLFRIAQEATTNAVKHGNARNILITLLADETELCLTVLDDGKGFDPRTADKSGMGLSSMKYRAQLIGGTLSVGPGRSGGVQITCTAPASLVDRTVS